MVQSASDSGRLPEWSRTYRSLSPAAIIIEVVDCENSGLLGDVRFLIKFPPLCITVETYLLPYCLLLALSACVVERISDISRSGSWGLYVTVHCHSLQSLPI